MTNKELLHAMGRIDPSMIAAAAPDIPQKKADKAFIKWAALAACFALIVGAIFLMPVLRGNDPGSLPGLDTLNENDPLISDTAKESEPSTPITTGEDAPPSSDATEKNDPPPPDTTGKNDPPPPTTSKNDLPYTPTVNTRFPSRAPQYFGSAASTGSSGGASEARSGVSVTARLVETLPDTYTLYDDWRQDEYRLLRMETVKSITAGNMPEEFYYLVPVAYMTDFSLYDKFLLRGMAQFTYEFSVLYNKTQGAAEQLDQVLFGYCNWGIYLLGEDFIAFDSDGNFDERLWKSNEEWIDATKYSWEYAPVTLEEAEEKARDGLGANVRSLQDIAGEAADALSRLSSFQSGIFAPTINTYLLASSGYFSAVRYINGFATNEHIRIQLKKYSGKDADTLETTKAAFSEEDMEMLPDLSGAVASVISAYENGEIVPPHISYHEELEILNQGFFGWYAKTPEGVIGIVRVTWRYWPWASGEEDDAYFIIEYGDENCRPIDRDELLEKFGDYETTYIFDGEYDKHGKVRDEWAMF